MILFCRSAISLFFSACEVAALIAAASSLFLSKLVEELLELPEFLLPELLLLVVEPFPFRPPVDQE